MGQLVESLAVTVAIALLLLAQYYRYRAISHSGSDRQGLARAYWRIALVFGLVTAFLACIYVMMLMLDR